MKNRKENGSEVKKKKKVDVAKDQSLAQLSTSKTGIIMPEKETLDSSKIEISLRESKFNIQPCKKQQGKQERRQKQKEDQAKEEEPQQLNQIQEAVSQQNKQIETPFPFKRKEIFEMFRNKKRGRTYNFYESKEKIRNFLLDLQQYGYDFNFMKIDWKRHNVNKQDLEDYGEKKYWFKNMRRKVYVRMQCKNRKCQSRDGRNNRWTSILGVAQIKFRILSMQQFQILHPRLKQKASNARKKEQKYPKMVEWQLKYYRQKCKRCNQWGQVYIYEQQLKGVLYSFGWVISQILAEAKEPARLPEDRHKMNEDVHKHEQSLCEACLKKKCFNIPKKKSDQIKQITKGQ